MLSAKTEYGCLAMLHLAAANQQDKPVQIRKMAAEQEIPWRFLVQILLELKRAGLVTSTRGAAGGYRLARDPVEISLGEVILALEGTEAPSEAPPENTLRGALQAACAEAQQAELARLAEISLTDLLARTSSHEKLMWYI